MTSSDNSIFRPNNIKQHMSLLDSDDSASNCRAGVARLPTLMRASSSKVISPVVHYEGSPDDAVWTTQWNKAVCESEVGNTTRVCSDVAQISDMAFLANGATVARLWRNKAWRYHKPQCFCVLLQVRTEVPEQGHMSVTLQAVWVVKRIQNNARCFASYISRVISMCVHRRQCSAPGCDGRPCVTEIAKVASVALRAQRNIA